MNPSGLQPTKMCLPPERRVPLFIATVAMGLDLDLVIFTFLTHLIPVIVQSA